MKIMKHSNRLGSVVGLILFLALIACQDNGVRTTNSGLEYTMLRTGGALAGNGDYIVIHAVFKTSRDSLVFDYRSNGMPLPIRYDSLRKKNGQLNDMEEVVFAMGSGDSCTLEMSPKLFYKAIFYSKIPDGLQEGDMIIGNIKVDTIVDQRNYASWQQYQLTLRREQVQQMAQQQEREALKRIDEYLDSRGVKAESTKNGTKYYKSRSGEGEVAQMGDSVFFNYEGRQLTGDLFSSSGEAMQSIVIGNPKNIDMWNEVLQNVRAGDRLSIYASYATAFGGGKPPDAVPGAAVMFDVEVLDIK